MSTTPRRRSVIAVAFVFWLASGCCFVIGLATNPDLPTWASRHLLISKPPSPSEPPPLAKLSAFIHFWLPTTFPTPFPTPFDSVNVKVTLIGQANITDNTPLTMIVDAPITNLARGNWTIGPMTVTPDNAQPVSSATPSTQLNMRWWTTDEYGTEIWNGTETLELTTFGVFGVTIGMFITPSPAMRDWENANRKYVAYPSGGYLSVHNSTEIIVQSSRELATELSAERATESALRATETGNSLTWFIIFLASIDIGFRIFDYSPYEEKNQPCKHELEEP